jgi:hypothetical protein
MELRDLFKKEDSRELFESKSCKLHEYDDCTLIKYPHGVTLDSGEGGWLKYCRGAVVNDNQEIVCLPPLRFKEGQPTDTENYVIQEYLDGTMINVFFNKKWYISTRSRIGALCRWHTKKTFRHMFLDIVTGNNGNFDILDETKSYTFVMIHQDNRIVKKYNKDEIVLVSVYSKNTKEWENPDNEYNKLKDEYDPWFTLAPEVAEETINLSNNNVSKVAGYTYINKNNLADRFKLLHPKYPEIKTLSGESHVPIFNYIENRRNGKIPEYLRYFPENRRIYNRFKHRIHDFTQLLYDTYGVVFKEKRCTLKEVPFSMKPLLYEIHGLYLDTKSPTGFSNVMEYINNLPTARMVFVLTKFDKDMHEYLSSKENENENEKENDIEHLIKNLDSDTISDIISKINSDENVESIVNSAVHDIIGSIENDPAVEEKNITEVIEHP